MPFKPAGRPLMRKGRVLMRKYRGKRSTVNAWITCLIQ